MFILYIMNYYGHNTRMPKESVDVTFTSDETPGASHCHGPRGHDDLYPIPPLWPCFQDGASSFAPFAKEVYEGARVPERAGRMRAKYAQNTPALSLSLSIRPSIELQEGISILRMLCYGEYGGLVSSGFWGRDARVDQS